MSVNLRDRWTQAEIYHLFTIRSEAFFLMILLDVLHFLRLAISVIIASHVHTWLFHVYSHFNYNYNYVHIQVSVKHTSMEPIAGQKKSSACQNMSSSPQKKSPVAHSRKVTPSSTLKVKSVGNVCTCPY